MKKIFFSTIIIILILSLQIKATHILIPMDHTQQNHLKAYGIAYWTLQNQIEVNWLLNYRGGSFMCQYAKIVETECIVRGVTYEILADAQAANIIMEISDPQVNMDVVKLEKAPKIVVYSPPNALPWDDAVTLALTYAEIPYDVVYDEEVLQGKLLLYDWLHLHHEDFTGQYGKFWARYANADWYIQDVKLQEATAKKLGYSKVSLLKLAVAKKIKEYVAGGGFLFTMCSGTDTFDIALAAEGVDICAEPFDGDPFDPDMNKKLNYDNGFAFTGYQLSMNPYEYEFSNIDASNDHLRLTEKNDMFVLFEFSAKWDPVPTMLCQNHEKIIKGFMGQTTAFRKQFIRKDVLIMGETKSINSAKYIHGEYGKGTWTFYGGHDPEDYQHFVGDPKTDLNLYPNSPGYRLILNNVLFPAAKKKKQKT